MQIMSHMVECMHSHIALLADYLPDVGSQDGFDFVDSKGALKVNPSELLGTWDQ
jgi:hypothetical protein